jgi:hypothetical protein
VFVKPFPVVVFRKRVEEFEEFRREHVDFSQSWFAMLQIDERRSSEFAGQYTKLPHYPGRGAER